MGLASSDEKAWANYLHALPCQNNFFRRLGPSVARAPPRPRDDKNDDQQHDQRPDADQYPTCRADHPRGRRRRRRRLRRRRWWRRRSELLLSITQPLEGVGFVGFDRQRRLIIRNRVLPLVHLRIRVATL